MATVERIAFMGWLFGKKKRTGKRRSVSRGGGRKSKGKGGLGSGVWLRVGRVALIVVGVVGGVAGSVYGLLKAEEALAAQVSRASMEEQPPSPQQVQLVGLPPEINDTVHHTLQSIVASRVSADPMDQASLAAAAEALVDDPWVIDVERVERHGEGIVVRATYRVPFAVVMGQDNRLRLIDAQGTVIRDDYLLRDRAGDDTGHLDYLHQECGYPIIRRVTARPPQPGQRWRGREIGDLVKLIELLRDREFSDGILLYEVAAKPFPDGQPRLVIRPKPRQGDLVSAGDASNIIYWGSAPGSEQPMEASPATKIKKLVWHYRRGLNSFQVDNLVLYLDSGPNQIEAASTN